MALDVELYRRTVYLPASGAVPRRVSVIDIEPEGARHTLVLMHGYGGNASQWLYQLRFLGAHFRVIAPDLRGHGLSSDDNDLPYTMDGLVNDLELVLASLDVQHPFSLIAHSFGGAIAAEYALRHPEALTGLVLIGVPTRFILRPLLRNMIMKVSDPLFSLIARVYGVALFAPRATLKPLLERVMETWQGDRRLSQLCLPTLVILGHRDTVFLREDYEDVPRSIPGAQRVVISVSAHLVQLERPDAVNRALRRFLEAREVLVREGYDHAAPAAIWSHPVGAQRLLDMPWLQHYDDDVPEQLPLTRQVLHDILSNSAAAYPRHPALIFFGQRISYRELDLLSNRFARALQALGVNVGDRVAIVLPNVPQYVISFYGTLKAGAVVVLGSPLSRRDEIQHQLHDAGATVLLTLESYRSEIALMCSETNIRHVVYTDVREYLPLQQRLLLADSLSQRKELADKNMVATSAHPFAPCAQASWHEHAFQPLLRRQSSAVLIHTTTAAHLAVIQYTSGTTDTPKGAMLTHANLMVNLVQGRHWMPDARRGREVVLAALPLSHPYGMTGAMNIAICLAGSLVLLPADRIEPMLHAIKTYRPGIFPGIPAFYLSIANYPNVRSYGLSAIRICISGSAPLPVEAQEAFEKLTRGHLVEGYGLTEASPLTHANPLRGERRVGSVGLPLPGTLARIVDVQSGAPLPIGVVGELLVKGPQLMQGYWNMPTETAQAFSDGWLHTGDLARMDEDGFFTIVDRKKDLILAGAYNVYPRKVEEVLYEHPKVLEAAVVPAGTTGNPLIKAVVVLKRGEQATTEELLALCRERLDAYEVPGQIEFRSELPKNLVGKVLKRLLVEA